MRPDIYPRTLENIKAVLLYYFPKEKHSAINEYAVELYDERKLDLNKIEYLAEIISNNISLFQSHYKSHILKNVLPSYFNAAHEILYVKESEWNMSNNGKEILKVIRNELL